MLAHAIVRPVHILLLGKPLIERLIVWLRLLVRHHGGLIEVLAVVVVVSVRASN